MSFALRVADVSVRVRSGPPRRAHTFAFFTTNLSALNNGRNTSRISPRMPYGWNFSGSALTTCEVIRYSRSASSPNVATSSAGG